MVAVEKDTRKKCVSEKFSDKCCETIRSNEQIVKRQRIKMLFIWEN